MAVPGQLEKDIDYVVADPGQQEHNITTILFSEYYN
jgi:hypothetical protein